MFRKLLVVAAVAVAFGMPAGARLSAGGQDASVKGVYREGKRSGVKVAVFAMEAGKRRRVATDYEFKSGDSFEIELETNQRAHVYVVNRTLPGDPATLGTKGIERIRDEDRRDRPRTPAYKLLYPMKNDPKVAEANKTFKLSGFKMDDRPGVEKMFILVSAKPIDVSRYFDVNGDQRTGRKPASGGGGREDTDNDVLDQLNKDLAEWCQNADSAMPKGVEREPEGYGVVRDPAKPGVVELTLLHFPASRRR